MLLDIGLSIIFPRADADPCRCGLPRRTAWCLSVPSVTLERRGVQMKASRREQRLASVTWGSASPLGFLSVSPLRCLRTRRSRPGNSRPLPAVLAQGLRASLSTVPSPEPLLLGRLPCPSAALATPASEPDLAGQRGRQGSPTRAMPALSVSSAPGRSARAAAGARGARPRTSRNDVRGPAPSNHPRRFLGAFLSAARLLCLLRGVVGLVASAFLLWLMSPGVAPCARSGSPLPAAAPPGVWAGAAAG